MTDITATLTELYRPGLLVRAARFAALALARRARPVPPAGPARLAHLLAEEADLNAALKSGEITYSAQRHIRVLAELLRAAERERAAPPPCPPQTNASGISDLRRAI